MAGKQAIVRKQQLSFSDRAQSQERSDYVPSKEESETKCLLIGFMGEMVNRDANMSTKQAVVMTDAIQRLSSPSSPVTESAPGEDIDETVVHIGQELAGIAQKMNSRGEEEIDTIVNDLLGTPNLGYKMFVRVATRIAEWNETGIVTVTASGIKALLHLCYTLCVRFYKQFGHYSNIGVKLRAMLSTVSEFLVTMLTQFGVYNWIREHGWSAILPKIPSRAAVGVAVGVVSIATLLGVGYLVYKRI